MSISTLYFTRNIRDFQLSRIEHNGGRKIAHVSQKPDRSPTPNRWFDTRRGETELGTRN